MHHAPRYDDDDDDDDDDIDSAEEDPEEELLIADPHAYRSRWTRRDVLIVAGLLLGWFSVSTSALITNRTILRLRHFEYPFTVATVYITIKWPLARLALYALRLPPLRLHG